MITQVNSSNEHKYKELYAKAMVDLKELKGEEVNIDSLESYFSKIYDLVNIKSESTDPKVKKYGRRYTILPLDEEHFEIDTNTRIIKVPEAFRKNGIAVQGDMAAETLYFRVPRYFDAIDLNNTEIYIQWQYINDQNQQPVKGMSHEWVRDIESQDDYLIFGWTLVRNITERAGNLQFSVRFIMGESKTDANGNKLPTEISYSLSTLTTSVLINPGLNYDIDSPDNPLETLDSIITSNFINTYTLTDSEIKAFRYIWDLDRYYTGTENKIPEIIELDLPEEQGLLVELNAYVLPGEINRFILYKQQGEEPSSTDTEIKMSIDYFKTEDTTYHQFGEKIYYQYNEESKTYTRYLPSSGLNINPKELKLFEKYGTTTLNNIGLYYGAAEAVINSHISSPQKTKYKILIPGPTELIIDNNKTKYTEFLITDDNMPVLSIDFLQKNEKDNIECQWYKIGNENELNNSASISTTYKATEPGKYMAKVKAVRNRAETEIVSTKQFIVTHPAAKPEIVDQPKSRLLNEPIVFEAKDNNNPDIAESKLTYLLYKITNYDAEGVPVYGEAIAQNTKPEFTVSNIGTYACGVYSTYNGDTSAIAYTIPFTRT